MRAVIRYKPYEGSTECQFITVIFPIDMAICYCVYIYQVQAFIAKMDQRRNAAWDEPDYHTW